MFRGAPNVSLNKFITQIIECCVYYVCWDNNNIMIMIMILTIVLSRYEFHLDELT